MTGRCRRWTKWSSESYPPVAAPSERRGQAASQKRSKKRGEKHRGRNLPDSLQPRLLGREAKGGSQTKSHPTRSKRKGTVLPPVPNLVASSKRACEMVPSTHLKAPITIHHPTTALASTTPRTKFVSVHSESRLLTTQRLSNSWEKIWRS